MTDVDLVPVKDVVLEEIEFTHLVCCNDWDLVLCGAPAKGEFTTQDADCHGCLQAARMNICPEKKMCTGMSPHEGN